VSIIDNECGITNGPTSFFKIPKEIISKMRKEGDGKTI